jgi:hypothetical protein
MDIPRVAAGQSWSSSIFPLSWTDILTTAISYQGIAPTLIAFRVAEENSQAQNDNTSRTTPLSRLTFRRSTRQTDAESGQDSRTSDMRFVTDGREGHGASVYSNVGLNSDVASSTQGESAADNQNITEEKGV